MTENNGQSTGGQQTAPADSGDQSGDGGQQQQTPPTPKDVQGQQQGTEPPAGDQSAAENVEDLPPWAQRLIRSTRGEAAQNRTARQQAEQAAQQKADERTKAILKAAGIDTGDDTEDPAKVAEAARAEREQAQSEARQARLELAVFRAAPGKNGDASALLDSRSFLDAIRDIDPTDTKAVTDAVEKAVQDNPKLAATQAAAQSGADFTGGSGDGQLTPEKFRSMSMAQRNELYFKDPDTYRRLAAS